jgi:hypothetical protein
MERMRSLTIVTEPSVRTHLQEAFCCFSVGVYRAAIVAGWCAVEQHLRLVLARMGAQIYECCRRDAKNNELNGGPALPDWHGESLFNTCAALEIFPGKRDTFLASLNRFYQLRCRCAHSTEEQVKAAEVMENLAGVQWLFSQSIHDSVLQNPFTAIKAIRAIRYRAVEDVAEVCARLSSQAREVIAEWARDRLLSRNIGTSDSELDATDDRGMDQDEAALTLWLDVWRVAIPLVRTEVRVRLMTEAVARLVGSPGASSLEPGDIVDHLIGWADLEALDDENRKGLWEWLKSVGDDITPNVARRVAALVPAEHKQDFLTVLPQAAQT